MKVLTCILDQREHKFKELSDNVEKMYKEIRELIKDHEACEEIRRAYVLEIFIFKCN